MQKRVFGYELSQVTINRGEKVMCSICQKQPLKKAWFSNVKSVEMKSSRMRTALIMWSSIFGWPGFLLFIFGTVTPEASTCVCSEKCAMKHVKEVESKHWTNNHYGLAGAR